MLKYLFLLLPSLVMAAPVHTNENPTGIIEVNSYPRVLHFNENRNIISQEGRPLICVLPNDIKFSNNQCLDATGTNAWRDAFSYTLDNYVVTAYEYRMVGSGYRHLFLYLAKK